MAAIRHARKRPPALQIPPRGILQPDVDLESHSATMSNEASSDLIPLTIEQRPFVGLTYDRGFYSQLFEQSTTTSTTGLKMRASVRGIAAGLKKVGSHLRRLPVGFKVGKGPAATHLGHTASAGNLPNTRFELPLVSPAGAVGEASPVVSVRPYIYKRSRSLYLTGGNKPLWPEHNTQR